MEVETSRLISLDDVVDLINVEKLMLNVPLDSEQIGWLEIAYDTIMGYEGKRIFIRQIDDALKTIGEPAQIQNIGNLHCFTSSDMQPLSLRVVRLSDENKRMLAEYERIKSISNGKVLWKPITGNDYRIYLAAKGFRSLYIGIAMPVAAPYLDFECINLVEIEHLLQFG